MARNKSAGRCCRCGQWVDVGFGYPDWYQGQLRVKCMKCAKNKYKQNENFNKKISFDKNSKKLKNIK